MPDRGVVGLLVERADLNLCTTVSEPARLRSPELPDAKQHGHSVSVAERYYLGVYRGIAREAGCSATT